ncbi:unnamed protein product [Didymodactylos carnosus]|uniref:G domain-containing protein n=1 Tax=Didymodactylos carnosus TaxID=1234261 RepID=A0A814PDS1_9BILA|nr:unnamed protein product [Didymodactylos carnosus]CAF3871186.1 unnamed protein product [Didymodactylos carnosus]
MRSNQNEIEKLLKYYQTQPYSAAQIENDLNTEKELERKALFIHSLAKHDILYFDIATHCPEFDLAAKASATSTSQTNNFVNFAKRLPSRFDKGDCYVFYSITENCLSESDAWKQFLATSNGKDKQTQCVHMDCTNCADEYQPRKNIIYYYKNGRLITEDDKQEQQTSSATSESYVKNDINILLLGETGVGKSTFINAFVTYITHNKLSHAVDGETIVAGVMYFQLRKIRIIDTPGVGDTRGLEQDGSNLEHIISYISHYQHLKAICMLLKPNASRLNTFFRFCIIQLLTYLNVNAKNNIIFCFTNARSTFYSPGNTTPLLKQLLKELKETNKIDIPFSKQNTFCFDDEAFRYLASTKANLKFDEKQQTECSRSWDISVDESFRFI